MKSSLVLLSGASMALAGPLHNRHVDIVYDVVTNVVTEVSYYTVVQEVPPVTVVQPSTTSSPPVVVVTVTVPHTTSVSSSTATPNVEVAVATTSSSSSSAAAAAASPTGFEDIALYHHNVHRANGSASDLTYDDTIAGYAATLAERCVFEHDV